MKRVLWGIFVLGMVFLAVLVLPGWGTADLADGGVSVPILMYHNFAPEDGSYTVSAERFRAHLAALAEDGYTTVTFGDLLAYADGTGELPEKPVVLVSDDGYTGVLTYALPVLTELDMVMSVAVIGELMGVAGEGQLAHFSLEELAAADPEGRLELVSHSWGLHRETESMRGAVNLTLPGDTYADAVLADSAVMKAFETEHPGMGQVFVYPFGAYSPESEAILTTAGYGVSVTTNIGAARICPGEAMRLLPRIPAEWYDTGAALLREIRRYTA